MLIEQVGREQFHLVDEVRDALVGRRRAAPDDADDAVALLEEELGEIGAVLARDPGDESSRHRAGPVRVTSDGEIARKGPSARAAPADPASLADKRKGSRQRAPPGMTDAQPCVTRRRSPAARAGSCRHSGSAYTPSPASPCHPPECGQPADWASTRDACDCWRAR